MIQLKEKNYKVVSANYKGFEERVREAWGDLGYTTEIFEESEKVVVNNDEEVEIGTIEFVNYNKGKESAELEGFFDFCQFQKEGRDLYYMDKVIIDKEHRGKLDSMCHMMQAIFDYMSTKRIVGKEVVVVASVRNRFFRYLKRMVCLDIIQLGPEKNGEIPMMIEIDSPENAKKLQSNTWCKLKI